MTLICKNEARGGAGKKVMKFTKGKKYSYTKYKINDGVEWKIIDDEGNPEIFWTIDIMFKL